MVSYGVEDFVFYVEVYAGYQDPSNLRWQKYLSRISCEMRSGRRDPEYQVGYSGLSPSLLTKTYLKDSSQPLSSA